MSKHNSQPHNPDIAHCFFRAGYVETWGRGIEKICEECAKHGIPDPEYTLHPEDIMVRFIGHKPPKTPKLQNEVLDEVLAMQLISLLKNNQKMKQSEIAKSLGIPLTSVQRITKELVLSGVLNRKGGKRFGFWEVNQDKA